MLQVISTDAMMSDGSTKEASDSKVSDDSMAFTSRAVYGQAMADSRVAQVSSFPSAMMPPDAVSGLQNGVA